MRGERRGHLNWHRYDPARKRLVLTLHVQPNARANEIAGVHGDALKVKIAAPAVDNKANAELIRFLSEALGVAKAAIAIRRGAGARQKVIDVEGGPELAARLARFA